MQEKTIINIQNLTKVFGDVFAVNDVSMKVKECEFVSLLGPSGCGKTTLLRMIAGLESPTDGKIFLHDMLLNNIRAYKRPINMIFQKYALFPHLNVYENIAFGPNIRGVKKKDIRDKVSKMLKMVKLEGFENRSVSQLSGGQAQRVALTRALVNEPQVLLLDEPLGALDLKLRREMQIELRTLQKKLGTTFIYVTHDQEEALVLSDRIMIMNEGKIIQAGEPTDIYRNPKSMFVSQFIGETNLLKGRIKDKNKEHDEMIVKVEGVEVKTYFKDDVSINDDVWISIRLENIKISHDAKIRFDNMLHGDIQNYIFLGSTVKYNVKIAGIGEYISTYLNINDSKKYYKPGEKIYINWNKNNCSLITK